MSVVPCGRAVPSDRARPRVPVRLPLRLVGRCRARRAQGARPAPRHRDRAGRARYPRPADLARLLRAQNLTIPSIAAKLGCTERTVYRYLANPRGLSQGAQHGQDPSTKPFFPGLLSCWTFPLLPPPPGGRPSGSRSSSTSRPRPPRPSRPRLSIPPRSARRPTIPKQLYVPGGTLYGLRTRVWTRRVMPDPRNPRVGPARRHPVAVTPGSTEEAHFRPIPEPDPVPDGRPELRLAIESREHLTWASVIAKKYILKDNDWRLSIRNQGVMTEVWLSAVTLVHGDGTGRGHRAGDLRGQQPDRRVPRHPRHPLGRRALLPRRPRAAFDRAIAQRGGHQRPHRRAGRSAALRDRPRAVAGGLRTPPRLHRDLRHRGAVAGRPAPRRAPQAVERSGEDGLDRRRRARGAHRPGAAAARGGTLAARRPHPRRGRGQGLLGRSGRARRPHRPACLPTPTPRSTRRSALPSPDRRPSSASPTSSSSRLRPP